MNRWLSIPAGCCFVAFGVLYAVLYGAGGDSSANLRRPTPAVGGENARTPAASGPLAPRDGRMLSIAEAERRLVSLRDDWLRPWRQWESSPHRLYSRAAPRPIPSMSAEIQLATESLGESDGCLVGVISVHRGSETSSMPGYGGRSETSSIPCVVDRLTGRVRFFHDGRWLTDDEWLTKAPTP